jgi:hypothetical protein
MLCATIMDAADTVEDLTDWLLAQNGSEPLAGAVTILECFGICLGAWAMGDAAISAATRLEQSRSPAHAQAKLKIVHFYMKNVLPKAASLSATVKGGAGSVLDLTAADFGVEA